MDEKANLGDTRAGVDLESGIGYCFELFSDASGGFQGTMDGGGHTISNLTIAHDGQLVGFLGCLNGGVIRDIVFQSPRVIWTGGDDLLDGNWHGVVAGYAVYAAIEDIRVFDGVVTGRQRIGGIVGTARESAVVRVSFEGHVGVDPQGEYEGALSGAHSVGGIIGLNEWTSVWDSYASGSVAGDLLVGGLIGNLNALLGDTAICRSYAAVDITLTGDEEDPRPGMLIGQVSGAPVFGSVQGEGPCAGSSEDWTVFGMASAASDASLIAGAGDLIGNAEALTFEALCQVETYETAGWDFEAGAWNPPTEGAPPTLR